MDIHAKEHFKVIEGDCMKLQRPNQCQTRRVTSLAISVMGLASEFMTFMQLWPLDNTKPSRSTYLSVRKL